MRRVLFLSSVGSSWLSHGAGPDLLAALRKDATALTESEVSPVVKAHVHRTAMASAVPITRGEAAQRSAELAAMFAWLDTHSDQDVHHLLIASDAWLGRQAAEGIATWSLAQGIPSEVYVAPGLAADGSVSEGPGMASLLGWLMNVLEANRGAHVVLNLTGACPGSAAFLQVAGSLYGDETVFLRGGQLVAMPKLPIVMDEAAVFRDHVRAIRRIGAALAVDSGLTKDARLFQRHGPSTALTPWAAMLWERARPKLYASLLESPDDRVAFGPEFQGVVQAQAPHRIRAVNSKIDQLVRYTVTGDHPAEDFDLTPLSAHRASLSTHEMSAWTDGARKRIRMHREGSRWVLDGLVRAGQ